MSGSHKKADTVWGIEVDAKGFVLHQDAQLAVLMDIRHELKRLNAKIDDNVSITCRIRDEVKQVNKRLLKAGFKTTGRA